MDNQTKCDKCNVEASFIVCNASHTKLCVTHFIIFRIDDEITDFELFNRIKYITKQNQNILVK